MPLRFAFIGFRHGHINGLYRLAEERDGVEIVAACEEDPEARAATPNAGVRITHDSYEAMLSDVECDVVACGDYFGIRGERLIQAMEAGRHVIGDKPLCTSLDELDRIEELADQDGLRVGCMLDLGAGGPFVTLKRMLRDGAVGEVHTITFLGQHPLRYGKRDMWNFEEGKHGGTINDIGIHAVDFIPPMTGRRIVEVTAARAWNARLPQHPHFQDGAIFVLRLDNDGVAMGDVSYLASDRHGYEMPDYWRFTISGTDGVIEAGCNLDLVRLWRHDTDEVIEETPDEPVKGAFFEDYLNDLSGSPNQDGLHTARVIESTRIALIAQRAADTGEFPVPV